MIREPGAGSKAAQQQARLQRTGCGHEAARRRAWRPERCAFVRWRRVSRVAEEPGRAGGGGRGDLSPGSPRSASSQGHQNARVGGTCGRGRSIMRSQCGHAVKAPCAGTRVCARVPNEAITLRTAVAAHHGVTTTCPSFSASLVSRVCSPVTKCACVLERVKVAHPQKPQAVKSVHGGGLPLPGRQVGLDGAALSRATRTAAVCLFCTSGTALLPVPLAPTVDRKCHLRASVWGLKDGLARELPSSWAVRRGMGLCCLGGRS